MSPRERASSRYQKADEICNAPRPPQTSVGCHCLGWLRREVPEALRTAG